MNKLRMLFLSVVLALGLGGTITFTGCKNPEAVAYKATGAIVITANGAMEGWLDYKNTHNVPPERVAAVKAVWDKFYSANQAAKLAITAYKDSTDTNGLNRALVAVSAASSEVVSLVLQFLPPEQAVKLKK